MLTFDIERIKELFGAGDDNLLGNDFFIGVLDPSLGYDYLKYPVRLDAYAAIFCLRGKMKVDINLASYTLDGHNFIFTIPGNIIRVHRDDLELDEDSRVICVAISKQFITNIQFDFNRLFNESMDLLNHPCINLDEESLAICRDYLSLGVKLYRLDFENKRQAIGSLLSSVFYVLGAVWLKQLSKAKKGAMSQSLRSEQIFDRFIHLVGEYHSSERNVAFYAERMCLTPKYLSKVVRSVSGRSAPEWIDAFVILEAKNLLKYSDENIKQIINRLNFKSQTAFYKFFKIQTGLTPSEYRKS